MLSSSFVEQVNPVYVFSCTSCRLTDCGNSKAGATYLLYCCLLIIMLFLYSICNHIYSVIVCNFINQNIICPKKEHIYDLFLHSKSIIKIRMLKFVEIWTSLVFYLFFFWSKNCYIRYPIITKVLYYLRSNVICLPCIWW